MPSEAPDASAQPRPQNPIRMVLTDLAVRTASLFSPAYRAFAPFYPKINSIFGWLDSPRQERWLFEKARSLPPQATLVEIGSYRGRSTAALAFGCLGTQKHIFALDLFDGSHLPGQPDYFSDFKFNLRRCGLESYVTPILGQSAETARTWNQPIDFLFIDGAHDYAGVTADIAGFFPHLRPGGIMALHDVSRHWPDVWRAWNQVASPQLTQFEFCSSIAAGIKPA